MTQEARNQPTPDLSGVKGYYMARCNDLKIFSEHGTPWDFVGGAMIIEWLANLAEPDGRTFPNGTLQRPYFVDLITEHLNDYAQFAFSTPIASIDNTSSKTKYYLPLQIYLTLRNPLVHAFALQPEGRTRTYVPPVQPTRYKDLDRPGCIVLCHRTGAERRWDGVHLGLVHTGDRCVLRSPDFIEDIETLIEKIFEAAKNDLDLAKRIEERFGKRRPVDSIGKISIDRLGPTKNLTES